MKNIQHANGDCLKAGVAMWARDKLAFKTECHGDGGSSLSDDGLVTTAAWWPKVSATMNGFKIQETKVEVAKSRSRQSHVRVAGLSTRGSVTESTCRQKSQPFTENVNDMSTRRPNKSDDGHMNMCTQRAPGGLRAGHAVRVTTS